MNTLSTFFVFFGKRIDSLPLKVTTTDMDQINLNDEFIKALHEKIPRKTDLINIILEVLRIEKEPASRRLNGRVQFSIYEMGLLAQKLNISLDSLLHRNQKCQWVSFMLPSLLGVTLIDELCDAIELQLGQMSEIAREPSQYSNIFNTLPLQFYINYPYLLKFMFYKWGHYFIGTDEFNDFSQWQLPERITKIRKMLESIQDNISQVLYIWDDTLVWTLAGEINFFYKMNAINLKDRDNIKKDLKDMLAQLEKNIKGNPNSSFRNIDFYVSNIGVGCTSWCISSNTRCLSSLSTNFAFSRPDSSYESYRRLKEWLDSFRNISVLISGSGELERRSFFQKQNKIIEVFLN